MTVAWVDVGADGTYLLGSHSGGRGELMLSGTPDGASVALEKSPDNGTTWLAVGDSVNGFCVLVAEGTIGFYSGPALLRAVVTVSGGSTDMLLAAQLAQTGLT